MGYAQLAVMSHEQGQKLFRLRPKVHMWYEIFLQMDCESPFSLSPLATCTWTDEDFIGRVSRVSRSAHGAVVSVRCMSKCLGLYQSQFRKTFNCRLGARTKMIAAILGLDGLDVVVSTCSLGNGMKYLKPLKPLKG